MPKIIEGLRDSILQTARELLLQGGYDALTIRGVAKACGVATGTVYNYFPAKDTLAASVMLADWLDALAQMHSAVEAADTLEQGLRGMYDALVGFRDTYSPAWSSYHSARNEWAAMRQRHGLLISQLAEQIAVLCTRLAGTSDEVCHALAAEALLSRSQQGADFAPLMPALNKLLGA